MKKSDLKSKTAAIKSLANNNQSICKPELKPAIRISNDNLSKSIRNKKDAQSFISELKNSLKK